MVPATPGSVLAPDADLRFTHQLLQMLAVPVFVLDSNAQVLIWNRACERLTGVPASEVVGTEDHWRSFYDVQRPTLADLVLRTGCDPAQAGEALAATTDAGRATPGRLRAAPAAPG